MGLLGCGIRVPALNDMSYWCCPPLHSRCDVIALMEWDLTAVACMCHAMQL
jgi:hypothetical protein